VEKRKENDKQQVYRMQKNEIPQERYPRGMRSERWGYRQMPGGLRYMIKKGKKGRGTINEGCMKTNGNLSEGEDCPENVTVLGKEEKGANLEGYSDKPLS